jgi:hypothetical protein
MVIYECPNCGSWETSKQELINHLKKVHKEKKGALIDVKNVYYGTEVKEISFYLP